MAWVWVCQEFGGEWIEIQLNVSHYPSVHPLFTTLPMFSSIHPIDSVNAPGLLQIREGSFAGLSLSGVGVGVGVGVAA
jgi:hypothetical protein